MYSLQIRKLVIVGVNTDAEEEACVAPVDDFQGAEFDEVGLVLLVAGGDEAVDLVELCEDWVSGERWRGGFGTSPLSFIFSSSCDES